MGLVTIGLDGIYQRLEFFRTEPGDSGDETFLCKAFRDGATCGITCPYNQYDLLVIHG